MALSDPIADMLTRIRNAVKAKFKSVDIPASMLKIQIAKVMQEQGFIKNYKVLEDSKQGMIRIYLKYIDGRDPVILGLERVSKPSRRMYRKSKEIETVLNGMGVSIISTSKGIMTDKQAIQENIGGEILCNIW